MTSEQFFYRSREVEHDFEFNSSDDSADCMYYGHLYRNNFLTENRGRHSCLQWGHWCWKQARRYPLDAVKYLLGRFPRD